MRIRNDFFAPLDGHIPRTGLEQPVHPRSRLLATDDSRRKTDQSRAVAGGSILATHLEEGRKNAPCL